MLFYYRLLFLLLGGITIFIFHRKALTYNKEQEYSIIGDKKDIRPYRVLWGIWLILLLLSLLPRFGLPKLPNIQRGNSKIITKNNEQRKNTKPIYRQIIDQQRQSELSGNQRAIINPITSGYYELITEDRKLIQSGGIAEGNYPIPQPIDISYCKTEDKYRNLLSKNGLHYNGFIYEYLNSNKKKDIVIGVLDTGITRENPKLLSHTIGSGKNVITQNDDIVDTLGHGSHVAGIILQMFPNARILPIKVSEDYNEDVYRTDIIAGLKYAIDQNVDIINMSFGGIEKDDVTNQLINEAVNKGILVIAAAGNESQDVTLYYPANYSGVVSVGSVGKIGKSTFSNYGADVEMPGECIYSTYTGGDFVFMDGTSMSTPHLAGIIGSYLSLDNKIFEESEIINIINKNLDTSEGKSLLNIQKFLGIEDKNNIFYGRLGNIKTILDEIHNKLMTLKGNLTESGLNETISYIDNNSSALQKNAKEIEELYASLNITEGIGVNFSKDIDKYVTTLKNLLNKDGVQLISKNSVLGGSLGTDTCIKTYDRCSYEEKQNGCDDTSYQGYVCGNFDIIITGGTHLPSKGFKRYNTMSDYQEGFNVAVYQGQNKFAKGNQYLGKVELSGIPKKLAGEATTTVYFEVDKYGFLSVEAVDDSNGNNRAIEQKLIPAISSVENEGDDYNKIKNNINYALDETNDMIDKINPYYSINPWNYISENM